MKDLSCITKARLKKFSIIEMNNVPKDLRMFRREKM